MATNAVSTDTIAITEKKMDMTLEDIIKMSKKVASKGIRHLRASIKSRGFLNDRGGQLNSNVQRFMKSRSSFRQGVLAEKRLNFQRNQFPVTTEVARRSAIAPARSRAVNPPNKSGGKFVLNCLRITSAPSRRNAGNGNFLGKFVQKETFAFKKKPKTMDALFANMKKQRMLTMKRQMVGIPRQTVIHRHDRGRRQQQHVRVAQFGKFSS